MVAKIELQVEENLMQRAARRGMNTIRPRESSLIYGSFWEGVVGMRTKE